MYLELLEQQFQQSPLPVHEISSGLKEGEVTVFCDLGREVRNKRNAVILAS